MVGVMSYEVSIKRLALFAHHGVHVAEKTIGQRFFLDIRFRIDADQALASDAIEDSVSYADVIERATAIFCGQSFNMIETAAARIADALLVDFPLIAGVAVTVHKPSAPVIAIVDDLSATVEKARNG
jgi:dihydroneopterin aldolase